MRFEIYSEEFQKIIGEKPSLHLLEKGFELAEGPVYFSTEEKGKGILLFTDQKQDAIYMIQWHGLNPYRTLTALSYSKAALFRSPTCITNGMTSDLEGNLIAAEAGGRRITRTERDGSIKTLVSMYKNKRFNSPNDVVVKSDGTIWFTDPNYGAKGFGCLSSIQDCDLPNSVYRFDPACGKIEIATDELNSPNGLAFSPDEKILYIADSGACQGYDTFYKYYPHAVYAFDVIEQGSKLVNKRVFTEISPGFPDGLRVDKKGNLYVGAQDGVQVFSPSGDCLGKILLPITATNLTFGGEGNNVLFICGVDSIWATVLKQEGSKPIAKLR